MSSVPQVFTGTFMFKLTLVQVKVQAVWLMMTLDNHISWHWLVISLPLFHNHLLSCFFPQIIGIVVATWWFF